MKLSHIDFEKPFLLQSDIVNVLVVESPTQLTKYCNELMCAISDDSGNFCLFDGDKSIKLGKNSIFISDVLSLDVESKKVVTKLFADLKNTAENTYTQDVYNIQMCIAQLMSKLNCDSLVQIDYDQDSDLANLFKAVGVKVFQDGNTILEKLTTFIKVSSRYLAVKNFFFVNLKCFMTANDLQIFYNEAQLENINLFLLERYFDGKSPNEIVRIIDKDLCEIIV